ncbi:MAG: hypothetical protein JNJ54_07515 [Myxococcaceae bacterium]|nr:hypothetical protein [Myxococcaceae bacterium]
MAGPVDPTADTSIERFRAPLDALLERPVGEASRAVRFDWRRSRIGFGVISSSLLELNNYSSFRIGGYVRKALGNFMLEGAVTYVFVFGSDATNKLALTPYRQFGRPPRVEVDLTVGYAIAEGVVTSRPGLVPAAQLVLTANVGVRYLFYPGGLAGLPALDVAAALFAPRISDAEITNLDKRRLPAMQVDRARYGLLAGFTLDVYFQPGIAVTPRVMMALPVFSGMAGAGLGWWWELSLAVGASL